LPISDTELYTITDGMKTRNKIANIVEQRTIIVPDVIYIQNLLYWLIFVLLHLTPLKYYLKIKL